MTRYRRGDKVLVSTISHGSDYFGSVGTILNAWRDGSGNILSYKVRCEHPIFGSIRDITFGKDEIAPLDFKGSSDYFSLVDRLTEESLIADLTSSFVDKIEEEFPGIDPDLSRDIADSLVGNLVDD